MDPSWIITVKTPPGSWADRLADEQEVRGRRNGQEFSNPLHDSQQRRS
jgi:hypothetical protein